MPGFFPERTRRDFGAGLAYPSDDGGFDEFFEFIPALARRRSFSATRAKFMVMSSSSLASTSATRTRSSAISKAGSLRPGSPFDATYKFNQPPNDFASPLARGPFGGLNSYPPGANLPGHRRVAHFGQPFG